MTPKSIDDYGGPYSDATPVEDPQTDVSDTSFNRMAEDVAQLTQAGPRGVLHFTTTAANPVTISKNVNMWGATPTVSRTALGTYEITFATSYADSLGTTETLSLQSHWAAIDGFVWYACPQTYASSAHSITVTTFNAAGAVADSGGGGVIIKVYFI